ncbi:hypothetical protein Q5P01_012085 [Channa striata]|uniref:Uncharacterized protein n=1 Tax=Channa striata TaxID=64152 RepID=A0AA88SSJ5_CHASR|nr:hypothetical protein Q5P01_012085 [Channa striata]
MAGNVSGLRLVVSLQLLAFVQGTSTWLSSRHVPSEHNTTRHDTGLKRHTLTSVAQFEIKPERTGFHITAPIFLLSIHNSNQLVYRFSTWQLCSHSGSATDLHSALPPWRENAERNYTSSSGHLEYGLIFGALDLKYSVPTPDCAPAFSSSLVI